MFRIPAESPKDAYTRNPPYCFEGISNLAIGYSRSWWGGIMSLTGHLDPVSISPADPSGRPCLSVITMSTPCFITVPNFNILTYTLAGNPRHLITAPPFYLPSSPPHHICITTADKNRPVLRHVEHVKADYICIGPCAVPFRLAQSRPYLMLQLKFPMLILLKEHCATINSRLCAASSLKHGHLS